MTQNDKHDALCDVMILNTGSIIPAAFMNSDFVHNMATTNQPLVMSTKKMNL